MLNYFTYLLWAYLLTDDEFSFFTMLANCKDLPCWSSQITFSQ